MRDGLRGNLRALELMFKVPLLQKKLADFGKSSAMTLEDWEQIAILVRGELNPASCDVEEGKLVRRQMANRLDGAVNARR